jgi:hypothetical protein
LSAWKNTGEGLTFRKVPDIVRFLLMTWGCMGWNEVNILSEAEGVMDGES